MQNSVKVGVGNVILKGRQVLLGLRKSPHGRGHWAPPGGHLEYRETPEACAIRETYEETGLALTKVYLGPWTNDLFENTGHYITLFTVSEYPGGEITLKEPHKCSAWEWVDFDALPEPLFLPIHNLFKRGFDFDYFSRLLESSKNRDLTLIA